MFSEVCPVDPGLHSKGRPLIFGLEAKSLGSLSKSSFSSVATAQLRLESDFLVFGWSSCTSCFWLNQYIAELTSRSAKAPKSTTLDSSPCWILLERLLKKSSEVSKWWSIVASASVLEVSAKEFSWPDEVATVEYFIPASIWKNSRPKKINIWNSGNED